ncbi:hypothetical protein GEMRC1_006254 [Eukaryota sp. GEM-RC1]
MKTSVDNTDLHSLNQSSLPSGFTASDYLHLTTKHRNVLNSRSQQRPPSQASSQRSITSAHSKQDEHETALRKQTIQHEVDRLRQSMSSIRSMPLTHFSSSVRPPPSPRLAALNASEAAQNAKSNIHYSNPPAPHSITFSKKEDPSSANPHNDLHAESLSSSSHDVYSSRTPSPSPISSNAPPPLSPQQFPMQSSTIPKPSEVQPLPPPPQNFAFTNLFKRKPSAAPSARFTNALASRKGSRSAPLFNASSRASQRKLVFDKSGSMTPTSLESTSKTPLLSDSSATRGFNMVTSILRNKPSADGPAYTKSKFKNLKTLSKTVIPQESGRRRTVTEAREWLSESVKDYESRVFQSLSSHVHAGARKAVDQARLSRTTEGNLLTSGDSDSDFVDSDTDNLTLVQTVPLVSFPKEDEAPKYQEDHPRDRGDVINVNKGQSQKFLTASMVASRNYGYTLPQSTLVDDESDVEIDNQVNNHNQDESEDLVVSDGEKVALSGSHVFDFLMKQRLDSSDSD